jgi:hypothetical protein
MFSYVKKPKFKKLIIKKKGLKIYNYFLFSAQGMLAVLGRNLM